jgi:hypothetical protein
MRTLRDRDAVGVSNFNAILFAKLISVDLGHESFQDWKTGIVPGHVQSRLAFL